MLDYIKNRKELYNLQNKVKEIEKIYWKSIRKAEKEGKKSEETALIFHEMLSEKYPYEIDLNILQSRILRTKAAKLNVPLPDHHDTELWAKEFNIIYLTDKGRYVVNKKIRDELKERREGVIQIIVAITGLIGVIIGLVSILKK